MGFVLDSTHRLIFEQFKDDDGTCLEIRVKPMSLEEWLAIRKGRREGGRFESDEELIEFFDQHLIAWNLENREASGEVVKVPATTEGVRSQDAVFVLRLVNLWVEQIGKVDDPLPQTSGDGRPSLEESIPMEPLSPSLAS